MRIIISLLVIVFSLHSCKEIPITPLNITKSLTLIGEKQVTNNSFGYSITKDSLLIMIAYGDADEKFIHVYDTAFNFKFSVGNKGKLFSECQGNDLRTTEIIRKMKNCSRDPWELAEVLNCKYEKLKNIVGL